MSMPIVSEEPLKNSLQPPAVAEARERVQQSGGKLQPGVQAESARLAALRHEIWQPLTVIQGFSEMIRDETLSMEEIKDYAAEISKEAAFLTELVARLR